MLAIAHAKDTLHADRELRYKVEKGAPMILIDCSDRMFKTVVLTTISFPRTSLAES